jgi:hypothetical protein
MNDQKTTSAARSEGMTSYLLAARAKQITRLKEDVAGLEEALQLSEAFISLLALAFAGDEAVSETVRSCFKEDGSAEVFVSSRALSAALGAWHVDIRRHDDGYALDFYRSSSKT